MVLLWFRDKVHSHRHAALRLTLKEAWQKQRRTAVHGTTTWQDPFISLPILCTSLLTGWNDWLCSQPFWQNYHAEVLAVRSNLLESEEEASKDRSWAPAALHLLHFSRRMERLSECCCSDLLCGICLWVGICCPWATEFILCCLWRLLGHLRSSWPIWRTRPPNAILRVPRSTRTVGPCYGRKLRIAAGSGRRNLQDFSSMQILVESVEASKLLSWPFVWGKVEPVKTKLEEAVLLLLVISNKTRFNMFQLQAHAIATDLIDLHNWLTCVTWHHTQIL